MDFYDFQYKMVTSYSQGKSPRLEKRKKIDIAFLCFFYIVFISLIIFLYIKTDKTILYVGIPGFIVTLPVFLMAIFSSANDIWYKRIAFTYNSRTGLFIYDINDIRFLSLFKLNRNHITPGGRGGFLKKLEDMEKLNYLLKLNSAYKCLETLVDGNQEYKGGNLIRRITYFKKYKTHVVMDYTVAKRNNPYKENYGTVVINNDLNNYNIWVRFLEDAHKKTAHVCKKCGLVMIKERCPGCYGTEIKRESRIIRRTVALIGIFLLYFLLMSILWFSGYFPDVFGIVIKILSIVCSAYIFIKEFMV